MLTHADIIGAIQKSLTPDLLKSAWLRKVTPGDSPLKGHCAAASEAFYWLCGGKDAGFLPVACSYAEKSDGSIAFPATPESRGSHWWVRGPLNDRRGEGAIYDITAAQFGFSFPYARGRGTGFQQPQALPSRRAKTIMDRVEKILGADELHAFRDAQIDSFQRAAARKQEPELKVA